MTRRETECSVRLALVTLALAGCTPHVAVPEPAPSEATPPPGPPEVVHEAERPVPLPAEIAPPPPRVSPKRPLANLAPVWHHVDGEGPEPQTVWAAGGVPVAMDASAAQRLQLGPDRYDLAGRPSELTGHFPSRIAGPLMLLGSSTSHAAIELSSGAVRWTTTAPTSRTYADFITSRVLVAQLYENDFDVLTAWALEDGKEAWRVEGGSDEPFTRVRRLWTDGKRGYLRGDRGLVVFDPTTGTAIWRRDRITDRCGVTSGSDFVVIEDPLGHFVLDAETGKALRRLDAKSSRPCAWAVHSYDSGVAHGVISQKRLFALEPVASGRAILRAFDLESGKAVWQARDVGVEVLEVDQDAVFVERDLETLVALDADTGAARSEISIGGTFEVQVAQAGGDLGPLVVVESEYAERWVLGREATPPTLEDYTIRGRLVPPPGMSKRWIKGTPVRVGQTVTKADASGRFRVKGRALGAIAIVAANDDGNGRVDWSRPNLRFGRSVVVLDGSGKYDVGTIQTHQMILE